MTAMRNIWAVTRETFLECARTRIVVIFLLLLAGCVLYVGFRMEGDGTLKGRIQTFLAYSTSLTQLLLGLVTIFLATGAVTGDIKHKYIFTLASKPLARWQYVLGRWCGVVGINAVLLVLATGAIYVIAQHLRRMPTMTERKIAAGYVVQKNQPDLDRIAVENEVFAARDKHRPDPFDISGLVEGRMKKIIEEKGLDNILRDRIRADLQPAADGGMDAPAPAPDEAEVQKRLRNPTVRRNTLEKIRSDVGKRVVDEMMLVKPGRSLRLTFSSLNVTGPDGPMLQVRYSLLPMPPPDSGTFRSAWRISNPKTGYDRIVSRTDSTKTTSSFMFSPDAVREDGRIVMDYINIPTPQARTSVKVQPDKVSVLQRVGGFEGNVVRAAMLILLRVMFLAAVAVMFGVFLSFPIATLSCMMIFTISIMSGFIQDATRLPRRSQPSGFDYFSHYLVGGVFAVLPKFSAVSPVDSLVNGTNISWPTVAREYFCTFENPRRGAGFIWKTLGLQIRTGMGLRTMLALLAGWMIFRRREVAGAQVR